MLVHGARSAPTQLRGVLPAQERRAVSLAQRIRGGSIDQLQPGSFRIVLGDALAETLGVKVGDSVVLIAPRGSVTPAGFSPTMRRFQVSGLFHSGMYEYDSALALAPLQDAARIYRLGDKVTGLRLALRDPLAAPRVVRELAQQIGGGFYISDWTRNHASFFRSIQVTKTMMFMILLLVVAVAAFNIVATLVMVVKEKRAGDRHLAHARRAAAQRAGHLHRAGRADRAHRHRWAARCWAGSSRCNWRLGRRLERSAASSFSTRSVYFMSELPAYVEWHDVLQVCAVAFLLCTLATLYPAWRAALTAAGGGARHD